MEKEASRGSLQSLLQKGQAWLSRVCIHGRLFARWKMRDKHLFLDGGSPALAASHVTRHVLIEGEMSLFAKSREKARGSLMGSGAT